MRFTLARPLEVRETVRLPGNVDSRRTAVVATEARGLVVAVAVDEGDALRAGQPLAHLRTTLYELQLQAAQGRLREAEARLQLAASQLRRARELLRDEVISQQDLDDAVSEHTAWQARQDQAAAEIAQLQFTIDRCVVRAPFDGVVTERRTDLGEWVELGGAVAEMLSLAELEVRIDVPERYYDRIAADVTADVTFETLPGLRLRGSVLRVIPQADAQSRTFPVRIGVRDPQRRIAVGMLAQVDLPVGDRLQAVVVPKDAVVRQGPREIVFRVNGEETVEPVEVRSGQGVGSWVVIDGPVVPGERVVTRGNERLRPGQLVSGSLLEYPDP